MSHRPRLAGDGRLRRPEKVVLYWRDFMRGRLSDRSIDPFDWADDRLLLAESFARLNLHDRAAAKRWFVRHGAVDRAGFVGPPSEPPYPYSSWNDWIEDREPSAVADHRRDLEAEQANVVWHLATLARLSETRLTREWNPVWGQLVVRGPQFDLIVGGNHAGKILTLPTTIGVLRVHFRDEEARQRHAREAEQLRASTAGWPVVEVGEFLWYDAWERAEEDEPVGALPSDPTERAKLLGTSWSLTVALERILMAPYVARAVERRFTTAFEAREVHGDKRSVLVPREERVWQSVLAPVYLQLFEALRRITEAEPGAAICHECGRPFLVLDARRRFFCNERERFRHAKRERRRRLRATGAGEMTR